MVSCESAKKKYSGIERLDNGPWKPGFRIFV